MKPTASPNSSPSRGPAAGPLFSRADLAPVLLLLTAPVAYFSKVLFTPALFFYRDVFNYSYPHARLIQEACRHATLPYWNPYWNYGEPVLANPNFLFFYPSTLLLILLPIDLAYTLHYVLHFALAAVGAYALARRWNQSRAAAFFAGFVFAFSGPMLSLGNFYNHVACAAWIPWALLFADRAADGKSRRAWLDLTLVLSLQFLAAEPFTLFATFGLTLTLALHRVRALRRPWTAPGRSILLGFLFAGSLMTALCAVQLLPSLDLLRNSRRGTQGLPYSEASNWLFHPLSLLEVVLPDVFGAPLSAPPLWTNVLNGRNLPYYPSVFVGFVPLFFAFIGWARGRDPRWRFCGVAAAILLVLSFARFTPAFALAYLLIPPLELVRFPVKLLVPAVFLAALAAGWGLDVLRKLDAGERWTPLVGPLKWLLALTALACAVSLVLPQAITAPASWILRYTNGVFSRGLRDTLTTKDVEEMTAYLLHLLRYNLPSLAGMLLGGIIWLSALKRGKAAARRALPVVAVFGLAQLAWFNAAANPTVPKIFYTYQPPVLAQAGDSDKPYRFCPMYRSADRASESEAFLNFDSIPGASEFSPLAQACFRQRLLLERGTMLANAETSLNVDIERSIPPYLYEFWVFALLKTPDAARSDCLFGRTNVKYLILPAGAGSATVRPVAPVANGSPQPSFLYEDDCFLPRAYVASRAISSASALDTLSRLSDPKFDARHEVLLAAGPEATSTVEGLDAGDVVIVERLPNTVTLHADLRRPGCIVLLDRFDPNWHATVDGQEVPVFRADQLFRAVYALPGKHAVRFYYRQHGLKPGLAVSLVALCIFCTLWARSPGRA